MLDISLLFFFLSLLFFISVLGISLFGVGCSGGRAGGGRAGGRAGVPEEKNVSQTKKACPRALFPTLGGRISEKKAPDLEAKNRVVAVRL